MRPIARHLVAVVAVVAALLALPGNVIRSDDSPQLGDLSFPTSGPPAAQPRFLLGVKLLHNFEYEEAQSVFRDCQRMAPGFVMAYWGEAMCFNHPLWGEQDLDAGRAVLRRLESAPTAPRDRREAGFLKAVRALFSEAPKAERNQRYLAAMKALAGEFPEDREVRCFYALALLGTCNGSREARTYMRAAGILEDLYLENRQHPGVLHYLIHCYDDPVHAPLGLRAARTYGSIANNSAHAKHMPAHIYLPLGMWDEMIAANVAAWEAGQQRLRRLDLAAGHHDLHALHALQWLQYGYLQTGDDAMALRQLRTMAEIHDHHPTAMTKWYFALMRADYVTNAVDWQAADMRIDMAGVELSAAASDQFAWGLAAIRSDKTGAERALQRIVELRTAAEINVKKPAHHHSSYFEGVYPTSIRIARILETQLEALIFLADGETRRAITRLEDAVSAEQRLAVGYGPPMPVKPSHELLGDVLLNLGRHEEAEQQFQASLRRTPRRIASLAGLAEAARRRNNDTILTDANQQIREVLGDNSPPRLWRDLPRGQAR